MKIDPESTPHALAWTLTVATPLACYILPIIDAKIALAALALLPAAATFTGSLLHWPFLATPESDRDWFKSPQFWSNYAGLWGASLAIGGFLILHRSGFQIS